MNVNLLCIVSVSHSINKEYIKQYHHDEEDDNTLKDLVDFCRRNGPQFADKLLDYHSIDERTLICFYDISMPSISYYQYKPRILFNAFSSVVTESEEALAYLVFENNLERWIYQAEETRHSNNSDNQEDVGSRKVPPALYQAEVKTRKDNIDTVGKWTDQGLQRYNERILAVRESRQGRSAFEDLLTRTYLLNEPEMAEVNNERRQRDAINSSKKKKRVSVMNVLNVAEL